MNAMFVFDKDGNLVNLADKSVRIINNERGSDYEASVVADGPTHVLIDGYPVFDREYLYCGTLSECRDFIGVLAQKLPLIPRPQMPSTPRREAALPASRTIDPEDDGELLYATPKYGGTA